MAPDLKPHGAGPKLPTDKGRELQKLLSTDQKLLWLLNMAFLTEYLESGSKKRRKSHSYWAVRIFQVILKILKQFALFYPKYITSIGLLNIRKILKKIMYIELPKSPGEQY